MHATDKLTATHDRLVEAVGQLATGEDWRAMLEVSRRFHTYSTGSGRISRRGECLRGDRRQRFRDERSLVRGSRRSSSSCSRRGSPRRPQRPG